MQLPKRTPGKPKDRRTERAQLCEQTHSGRLELAAWNHASNKTEPQRFGGTEGAACENQLRRRSHADELRKSDKSYRRKAAQLYFRLAELGGIRGNYKITKCGKFHTAAKTMALNERDGETVRLREAAEDCVKCGKHLAHAFGSVVGNIHSRRKGLESRTPENHEIRFGDCPPERGIQSKHHWNIKNIQRRAVKSNPCGAVFCNCLNRIAHTLSQLPLPAIALKHTLRQPAEHVATCPGNSADVFRRRPECPRYNPASESTSSVAGLPARELSPTRLSERQRELF